MAIIGITTEQPNSIVVHILAEDFWIDRDMNPIVYLNPLIFWTLKPISKFSIILHGKPVDIKNFSQTDINDNRIINIICGSKKNEECNAIVTSDLLANDEYLRLEVWDEYEGIGEGDKPTLGLAKNISPIFLNDIDSIKLLHQEMEECSILEISLKKQLDVHKFYGLRIGIFLDFPYKSKLLRKLKVGATYRVHYCTFKGVSLKDKAIIREKYLNLDTERLAPIVFNVRPCELTDKRKNSSPVQLTTGIDTSSLSIYMYRGGLFGKGKNNKIIKFIERHIILDYRIDESITSGFRRRRTFKPFNLEDLDQPWHMILWTQRDFRFNLSQLENHHGNDFKFLRPSWDKGHDPITVAIEKFDSSNGLNFLAIYITILPFIYFVVDKLLNPILGKFLSSFMLLFDILLTLFMALLFIVILSKFFGKEIIDLN